MTAASSAQIQSSACSGRRTSACRGKKAPERSAADLFCAPRCVPATSPSGAQHGEPKQQRCKNPKRRSPVVEAPISTTKYKPFRGRCHTCHLSFEYSRACTAVLSRQAQVNLQVTDVQPGHPVSSKGPPTRSPAHLGLEVRGQESIAFRLSASSSVETRYKMDSRPSGKPGSEG